MPALQPGRLAVATASPHLKDRFANFQAAIKGSKTNLERDHHNRLARRDCQDQLLSATDASERSEAERQFVELEKESVRAKNKLWSTADFESLRVLGEGSYGVVFLARLQPDATSSEEVPQYVALKQMKKVGYQRKNQRKTLFAERNLLAEARSRWLVDLYMTFQDKNNIYMVMEFLQGGDLIGHMMRRERLTEEETRFYMAELLEALDTVHRCGFIHRDVKPDNMVLSSSGHLKLLDFGLCRHDEAAATPVPSADVAGNASPAPAGIPKLIRVQVAVEDPAFVQLCATEPAAEVVIDPSAETIRNVRMRLGEELCQRGLATEEMPKLACGTPPREFADLGLSDENLVSALLRPGIAELVPAGDDKEVSVLVLRLVAASATACGPPCPNASPPPMKTRRATLKSVVGTPQYMAPECFYGKASFDSDLWSLGVMTFECMVGHVPFHAGRKEGPEAIRIIRDRIIKHKEQLPIATARANTKGLLTPTAESFFNRLLCDREVRASAEQCRQDPFFHSIDFARLHEQTPPIMLETKGPADAQYFNDTPSSEAAAVAAAKRLPKPKLVAMANKDITLEWAHYEFDRRAHDLQRADRDAGGIASTAACLPSRTASASYIGDLTNSAGSCDPFHSL